jgi:triosephosphate isomerase
MRRPFVAGNWKMNRTVEQATLLVADLLPGLQTVSSVDRVLCPPFTSLMVVSGMLVGTEIGLGAQNMYWEEQGAYTGEVSPLMIKEFCQYVILGHSERRKYYGETDEGVNRKLKAAFARDLIPIVCIGETLEENEAGRTADVVQRQVLKGLEGINKTNAEAMVVAYEPVWAIGTGRSASPEAANEIIGSIVRKNLAAMFGEDTAAKIRILYGGSVKSSNAKDFFVQSEIDGALVGGASLKAAEFVKIAGAAVDN